MANALATVSEYVAAARVLLQDETEEYRYSDAELVFALNAALMAARKLRVDLFIGRENDVPNFTVNNSAAVDIDIQYRTPIVLYMVGWSQLRDEEDTQDARSGALLTAFRAQMVTLA